MSIEFHQTVPSRYKGPFPMIAIRDQWETYCTPLEGYDPEEVLEYFRVTYDWNPHLDLTAEEFEAVRRHDPVSGFHIYLTEAELDD